MNRIMIPQELEQAISTPTAAITAATQEYKKQQQVIDASWLVSAVEASARYVDQNGRQLHKHLFTHAFNRPMVYIADERNKYITTTDELITLCSQIQDVYPEKTYMGADHAEVHVLKCRLPKAYTARVPYVKLRHVPSRFSVNDGVVVKPLPPKNGGEVTWVTLCRKLLPIYSNRELFEFSQSEITAAYHYITLKIRKENHSLKTWFPGVDVNCGVCSDRGDEFVLVGPHFERKEFTQSKTTLTLGDL